MLQFLPRLQHIVTENLPFESPRDRLAGWMSRPVSAGLLSDGGGLGRYSYLMADGEFVVPEGLNTAEILLNKTLRTCAAEDGRPDIAPFTGGFVGLASFELGLRLENLKARPFRIEGRAAWPELVLMRFAAVLVFDHHNGTLTAVGRGETQDAARVALHALVSAWHATPAEAVTTGLMNGPLQLETPDEVHEDKVAALIRQIHAGDLFQANLARGWTGRLRAGVEPGQVMQALQGAGAAPFGGFVRLHNRAVVSNSPERFIRLDRDGVLETRPIKGTRPRGMTPQADTALGVELLASTKDRAENLMIVDLMRHDLSKVAKVGSVAVTALHALESYPNVHHLVSTVTAQLEAGKTAADVLLATFPPGSISGAPKVQAMKVISEVEAARGPYCGSLFFVDAGGAMDSNVLIRTLAFERDDVGRWHFRVAAGGGIVADSVPVAERIETETKLSLIKRVLEG